MNRIIPNAFQIPNFYVDVLMRYLKPNDFLILTIIVRKTFGWGKDRDNISISQMVNLSGLSERSVHYSVSELLNLGIIVKVSDNNPEKNYGNEYAIETDPMKYKIKELTNGNASDYKNLLGLDGVQNMQGGGAQYAPTKTNTQKNKTLTQKDYKDVDGQVRATIEASDKSKAKGYTLLPEPYIPYAESFSEMTGIKYIKKYASDWMATINDWMNLGYTPEDVRTAINDIQNEGKAGMISRPGSIDWKLRANQSKKSAKKTSYLDGWKNFDEEE